MASSRKPKRSKAASLDLAAHVAAHLKTIVGPGDRLLLGLSGGIDSVVLLDVLARLAPRLRFDLRALHVNHQLSPNAAAWARFCKSRCRSLDVPCSVIKVDVARGDSTERAAREARYAALRRARSDYIVLAHNADDQAETVLLQLLRGAGVKGLAAMPLLKPPHPSSLIPHPSIVRPLLDVPRAAIEAHAKRRKLEWIEDESNASGAYLRNWLRHEIVPRIAERVPGYRVTLTRASRHFGEAAALLDDLAQIDGANTALSVSRLRELSPARAKNLLRYVIAAGGWRSPEAGRIDEALRQALTARGDARVEVDLGDCTLRRHGDALHLEPRCEPVENTARVVSRRGAVEKTARVGSRRGPVEKSAGVAWRGERKIVLGHLNGALAMEPRRGTGISLARLDARPVTIRSRQGGETLRPAVNRPNRTVKNLLQEAGIPAWERDRLPFIYSGDTLVCIPGVAIDHRYQAQPKEASVLPSWRPARSGGRA